jgi:hypothetical protein
MTDARRRNGDRTAVDSRSSSGWTTESEGIELARAHVRRGCWQHDATDERPEEHLRAP